MNEDELKVTVPDDDDIMLPSGWDGKSPLFAEDGSGEVLFHVDAQEETTEAPTENENSEAESEDAPTTGEEETPAEDPSAADEEPEAAPDGEPEQESKSTRVVKIKVNHKEEDIDINAMSDEELVAAIQKSRAYDVQREARNKETYRRVYQEQIDAGMTEAAARLVAQNEADGKQYSLTDEEETPAAEESAESTAAAEPTRDLTSEIAQLKLLYPEFKTMPNSVAKAWSEGVPLVSAYIAYREQKATEAAATLRKENNTLKQNAASAAKAPVKGLTGGGGQEKQKSKFEQDFLKGFNSDPW